MLTGLQEALREPRFRNAVALQLVKAVVDGLQTDPARFLAQIEHLLGPISRAAPETFAALLQEVPREILGKYLLLSDVAANSSAAH